MSRSPTTTVSSSFGDVDEGVEKDYIVGYRESAERSPFYRHRVVITEQMLKRRKQKQTKVGSLVRLI